jgi:hypothetical protein
VPISMKCRIGGLSARFVSCVKDVDVMAWVLFFVFGSKTRTLRAGWRMAGQGRAQPGSEPSRRTLAAVNAKWQRFLYCSVLHHFNEGLFGRPQLEFPLHRLAKGIGTASR